MFLVEYQKIHSDDAHDDDEYGEEGERTDPPNTLYGHISEEKGVCVVELTNHHYHSTQHRIQHCAEVFLKTNIMYRLRNSDDVTDEVWH